MKNLPFHKRIRFSLQGLSSAFQTEASFRFQIAAAVAALLVLILCRPSPIWWAVVSLTVGAVLTAELINTALESLMDRVHPDIHPGIQKAKDCAAAAVLIASLMSLAVLAALIIDRFYYSNFPA